MDSLHQQPQSSGIPHGIREILPAGYLADESFICILLIISLYLIDSDIFDTFDNNTLASNDECSLDILVVSKPDSLFPWWDIGAQFTNTVVITTIMITYHSIPSRSWVPLLQLQEMMIFVVSNSTTTNIIWTNRCFYKSARCPLFCMQNVQDTPTRVAQPIRWAWQWCMTATNIWSYRCYY